MHSTVILDGKKMQQRMFAYSSIERALAEVLSIEPKERKSFKAKIRHLRDINVPRNLPRPGSGKDAECTFTQVLEVAFALALEKRGFTPRLAASWGPRIADDLRRHIAPDDIYCVFSTSIQPLLRYLGLEPGEGFALVPGFETLAHVLKDQLVDRETDSVLVINATRLARKVEQALTGG